MDLQRCTWSGGQRRGQFYIKNEDSSMENEGVSLEE